MTIAPAPLTIACVSPATGQVGVAYSGSAVASGGVAPYTYAIVGTLPAGLTLNAATGQISGTPTATGELLGEGHRFERRGREHGDERVQRHDRAGPADDRVRRAGDGAGGRARIAASAVASGGVGPYTYAIVGTLPAGLTLNAATGPDQRDADGDRAASR